jgi:uracil-DNA glycosylase
MCVDAPHGRPLPHAPRPVLRVSATARILIAGQAPGTRVHASGIPFTDPSGDRLRAWMGVDAATFYDTTMISILPMGFCFPGLDAKGGDLPPRRECAPAWRQPILAAMPDIAMVLAIGLYAQRWHLGGDRGRDLTATVADWRRITSRSTYPHVWPLPHPSWRNSGWLKANPWFETDYLPVLRDEVAGVLAGKDKI